MDPVDLRLLVYLHLQSGEDPAALAASLDTSEEVVWRLYDAGEALVRSRLDDADGMAARLAELDRSRPWDTPEQRRSSASALLTVGGYVTVEPPDPEEGIEATWLVLFDDVAAVEFEDLVRLTVDRLHRVDGVDGVVADDRDLIAVTGSVPRAVLEQTVSGWWGHWLRGVIGDDEPGR
ncbi:MAG: hypothetical protein ACXWBN_19620 [Acidimicrobiales bacterium]